ncbi:VWA domain-containing protein [Faunimonas sp. B44]|uniref:VWA domain-containing protein n=1 Tax=Faunimonas sp. B44 TaxID=3461493 RepID=UPI004044F150
MGVVLLRPFWLLAIPLVGVVTLLLWRRGQSLGGWRDAVDPPLLIALERIGRIVPGTPKSLFAPAAVATVIALALAGPARQTGDAAAFRNLNGLVIAIDLSRSVAEGGRLPQAITTARWIADRAASRPVALIVFAGDAYLASGFTTDAHALGTTMALLDGETVPDPGSRPERALSMARRLLSEAEILAGDVILFSDGGGITSAALEEARAIRAAGARLSTVHVEPVDRPPGMPLTERTVVDEVARAGGGLAVDTRSAGPVAELASASGTVELADRLAGVLWVDFGRHLLLLAFMPALLLFRRSQT